MSNNLVSLPGSFSFGDWVADLNKSLPTYNIPIFSGNEESWREWVGNFMSVNPSADISLPSSKTWQQWAGFFINEINNG